MDETKHPMESAPQVTATRTPSSALPAGLRQTAADRPGVAQPVPVRDIPALPWNRVFATALVLFVAMVAGWELYWRDFGVEPSYRNSDGQWAEQRRRIDRGDGGRTVLIGASRMLFDVQLPVWERLTGERPIQLAMEGTSPIPVLEDLAGDREFHRSAAGRRHAARVLRRRDVSRSAFHVLPHANRVAAHRRLVVDDVPRAICRFLRSRLRARDDGAAPAVAATRRTRRAHRSAQARAARLRSQHVSLEQGHRRSRIPRAGAQHLAAQLRAAGRADPARHGHARKEAQGDRRADRARRDGHREAARTRRSGGVPASAEQRSDP